MKQEDFVIKFCSQPQNFAWFLGAGSSAGCGLPTATDLIWILKRKYYCSYENQEITRHDLQNEAVKSKIQAYMDSQGFPPLWSDEEYSFYFEKIFSEEKEEQRKFIKKALSEDKVNLNIGNRVLGALLSLGYTNVVFSTNFDSVVEKSVAEVGGKTLTAYHLEGSHNAVNALNNNEYPFYCKLHGDFQYDSIKNLSIDLKAQNQNLTTCFITSGSRMGFIVSGYSGRDKSVMDLFFNVIDQSSTPFPHGLYWTIRKGSQPLPIINELLEYAASKAVKTGLIEIQTYDTFLSRIWKGIDNKPLEIQNKVVTSALKFKENNLLPNYPSREEIDISAPLIRMNALPLLSYSKECFSISLASNIEWSELRAIRNEHNVPFIFTKKDRLYCWGEKEHIQSVFANNLVAINEDTISGSLSLSENLHFKNFLEEALALALIKNKSLVTRTRYSKKYLIIKSEETYDSSFISLKNALDAPLTGNIPNQMYVENGVSKPIQWAEALQITLEEKNGGLWLLIEPDLWIWPPRCREEAIVFLKNKKSKRFNNIHDKLLSAWICILFGVNKLPEKEVLQIEVSPFDSNDSHESPTFKIGSRTAFTRKQKL